MKKIGRALLYTIGTILILTLIVTIFNYFNIFSYKVVVVFKIIIPILAIFIGGFIMGRKSLNKGWLEGIKYAIIFIIILSIMNYLFLKTGFKLQDLIYYLILMLTSAFGSIMGINYKKEKKES
ncbi:MAG: TIGR04086 family membrane protein [Ignavibacteriales bacterium]